MLGAIEQKIKDIKYTNCQKNNTGSNSYGICPWNGDVSNIYLPTPDELYRENIYFNGKDIQIEDIKNEIIYQVEFRENKSSTGSAGIKNAQKKHISIPHGYTLQYKKNSYSLDEAKAILEKKPSSQEEFLVTSIDQK